MRRHRPAEVILPMLALPLLLAGLAMLVLPEPAAYAQPPAGHGHARDGQHDSHRAPARKRPASHFTLIPRSLMP
ncbi:MAG: hypothetical protein IAE66_08420 [Xanthomonadaceae bacterium]|nr:hypothetical protein [Xanthomonadaceae bacterium]